MARHDPVVDHLIELLAPLGEPEAKRMFGVRGVYLDGLMVALVADGRVYLKADAENLPAFEAAGPLPFAFRSKQRTITGSYRSAIGRASCRVSGCQSVVVSVVAVAKKKKN